MRTVLTALLGVLAVAGWGIAAGLGAALAVVLDRPVGDDVAAVPAVPGPVVLDEAPAPGPPAAAPGAQQDLTSSYQLTVHTDGCGVIRTEGPGGRDLDPLTWSVVDADGFEVLGRNALGETHYRYFGAGTYDVVLEAWGGGSYVPVSNTVTITC